MLEALRARLASVAGYRLVHNTSPLLATDDMEPEFLRLYQQCRPYTMTSITRMYALYQGIRYVVAMHRPGAFVECGVWRGGSAMLAALTLLHVGRQDRDLFLYDTFAGMAAPTAVDVDPWMVPATATWRRLQHGNRNDWCYAPLSEVRQNLASTGYATERLHFIEGRVEDTIPAQVPDAIALLRLDTDWYESTRHELVHLYPRLSPGGVLIVDDYGYWKGARKAVDEYFATQQPAVLLQRVDSTGRMGIKPSA